MAQKYSYHAQFVLENRNKAGKLLEERAMEIASEASRKKIVVSAVLNMPLKYTEKPYSSRMEIWRHTMSPPVEKKLLSTAYYGAHPNAKEDE